MTRIVWILALLVAVLSVAAGFSLRNFFNPGARLDPEEARFVEQQVNRHVAALTERFEYSKATPISREDIFPELSLPVLRGSNPNWSEATVITVGSSSSSSARDLYDELQDTAIQKVHILSRGPYVDEQLDTIPEDVIVLDGTSGDAGDLNISDTIHKNLGIHALISGYLIDTNQKILFAQVNKGDFSTLGEAVKQFVEGVSRPTVLALNEQRLLPVRQALPLTELEQEFRNDLISELSKPVALVFLSDKTWCDICQSWLSDGSTFIESWRERGYGLVLVEGGNASFSLSKLENSLLQLSDVRVETSLTESRLMASWGATGIPATLVLRDGVLQGEVSWLEMEIDAIPYRDIHFRAVDAITSSLETVAPQDQNIALEHRAHVPKAYSISAMKGDR